MASTKQAKASRKNGKKGGRPKGSKNKFELDDRETAKAYLEKKFRNNMDKVVESYLDLAIGHKKESSDGRIYTKSPDRSALKDICNRVIGKVKDEFVGGVGVGKLEEVQNQLSNIINRKKKK